MRATVATTMEIVTGAPGAGLPFVVAKSKKTTKTI